MEIKIGTEQILRLLYILSWIIFIGVCVEAGGFIFNALLMLVFNPADLKIFWQQVDLSGLYEYDRGYFGVVTLFMIIVAVMKALIFYLIVKILHDKKLDMFRPFSKEVERFIFKVAYLSFGIGLFSHWGVNYSKWLMEQGAEMPDLHYLRLGGADVWLFMGVVLLVIAHIFRRGVEMQTENDLTI